MHRTIGAVATAMLLSMHGGTGTPRSRALPRRQVALPALDVTALLAAAHGAPPLICALASQSIRGWWGDQADAPSTPLAGVLPRSNREVRDSALAAGDADKLLAALASNDACVRELSIRVLGEQQSERVTTALIARLSSPDASMREVASYGLGMVEPPGATDALITTLRDEVPAVRANSAWALGRIESGRALASLVGLFRDSAPMVRIAAVVAVGRIDSTSAVPALLHVLQQDESAEVRRVAAWALGQREAREVADALANALGKEHDARVREMIAWGLGNSGGHAGSSALSSAVRHDSSAAVRETSAWALAETGDRAAVDVLGDAALDDKSTRVRGTAAWAIGQLRGSGVKRAARPPARTQGDEDRRFTLKAAQRFGQVRDPDALGAIQDALKVEQSNEVRRALVRALIKSGGNSEKALTDLLNSSDASVREAAVRGLAGNNSFNPWPWPWPRPRPFP